MWYSFTTLQANLTKQSIYPLYYFKGYVRIINFVFPPTRLTKDQTIGMKLQPIVGMGNLIGKGCLLLYY